MGARNQVGIGLSYRPASLATQFQTRFLELIPRPIAGLKFSTLKRHKYAQLHHSCIYCSVQFIHYKKDRDNMNIVWASSKQN
jgi:hypothetical protein